MKVYQFKTIMSRQSHLIKKLGIWLIYILPKQKIIEFLENDIYNLFLFENTARSNQNKSQNILEIAQLE